MSLTKLIAVTHGDVKDPAACGRPLTVRRADVRDPASVTLVYECPIHGAVLEPSRDGGFRGAVAFFAQDERPLAPKERA